MIVAIVWMIASFLSGYFFIEWMEIATPFDVHDFLLGLVFRPVEFLAAGIAFCSSLVVNAYFFHFFMKRSRQKKQGFAVPHAAAGIVGFVLVYGALFSLSPVHTLVLFGSSLVYGIISLYV
ncbi:hypothetical protein [Bacillus sp. FJAT-27445]|uniref:hypothetical protein n=1 Tax=Bacillus sp. FJAT-27445 TaxID=1679166 RepID=UPI0007444DFB|nr:hypothetical protein [Bacillus sp. FJAT-27445]